MQDDMTADDDSTELRGPCPRQLVDVLDAVSLACSLTRTQLVNEILGDWVRRILHECTVIARTLRVIPPPAETPGKGRA